MCRLTDPTAGREGGCGVRAEATCHPGTGLLLQMEGGIQRLRGEAGHLLCLHGDGRPTSRSTFVWKEEELLLSSTAESL